VKPDKTSVLPGRRWYWWPYFWPVVGLLAVAAVDRALLVRVWPEQTADLVSFLTIVILAVVYGWTYQTAVERQYTQVVRLLATTQEQRDQLRALQEAMTIIAQDREWEKILLRVVEVARELTGARYGALAVLSDDETIVRFITSGLTPEEIRRIGALPTGKGLLGEVIRRRKPLRVSRISDHPASSGWPPGHPVMTTFLGMPILFRDLVVGHLYLTDKAGGEFTANDEELVMLLASEAAVLITNARLNERIEELAVVEERERIGMDLHDGTIQSLYGVSLALDALLAQVPNDAVALRDGLDDAADRILSIIQDIRHYIFGLRQAERQWRSSVEGLAKNLGLSRIVRVQAADEGFRRLSPREQDVVIAWVHEALSNVARHAHAGSVTVSWSSGEDGFTVLVEDDGVGFNPGATVQEPGHFGLTHLARRAEALRGTMRLDSEPGRGTRVVLTAPYPAEPDAAADGEAAVPGE
jgi:signal transduction histidine kinase